MWIHLLSLGLIDGANGNPIPKEPQRNGAGFGRLDRGHYKYKYKIEDEAVEIIEKTAVQYVNNRNADTLKSTFERLGVIYNNAYNKVFLEIVAQLRAQKDAQDADDEQIAMIMAAMT